MIGLFARRTPGPAVTVSVDGAPIVRFPLELLREVNYLWTRLCVHDHELPRSIALTSYLSGEGVTLMSSALAMAASNSRQVCLVETNRRPGLAIGGERPGLVGVVNGTVRLDDVIIETDQPGLSIIPARVGSAVDGDRELADSDRVTQVVELLETMFDIVILDLPAITTSDASLTLASAADAAILVARQGVIDIEQVEAAVAELHGSRLLGTLLNANKPRTPPGLQRWLGGGS